MKKQVIFVLLFLGVGCWRPSAVYATTASAVQLEIPQRKIEQTTALSRKKVRKMRRIHTKLSALVEQYRDHHAPDFWLWMGLFLVGFGVCISLFSVTLGGIAAAAGLGCLFIWGFFKLGAL
ncbi:MAG: hypothetical protein IT262_16505 [Saprospiraceae bacterium]|jgi:hypothetical protein|nr:hypothetical protein [Saprospiraceae bacterium]